MAKAQDPLSVFNAMADQFENIKEAYDTGENPLDLLYLMGVAAAKTIADHTVTRKQGSLAGIKAGTTKNYEVFVDEKTARVSRPVRSDLYLKNPKDFEKAWNQFINSIDKKRMQATSPISNAAIYTCICAVSCAYDIYKPTSRKTPGTYFEVLIGTILSEVSNLPRGKQVTIPNSKYKVPTDIVLLNNKGPQLIIPTKITTRERIVQVWAQQRILEDVFQKGAYLSALVAMSEMQRAGNTKVNEICVPGQVGLFQKFLSTVSGMYYLDVPKSYLSDEITGLITVADFGQLLKTDLCKLLTP